VPSRVIILACLALAAGVIIAGCTAGLPPDVAACGYVNPAARFALNPPAGWKVLESTGGLPAIFTKPADTGPGRPNLSVSVDPAPPLTMAKDIADANVRRLENSGKFRLISEDQVTLASGQVAWVVTGETTATPRPVTERQLYVVARDRLYVLTAAAASDEFPEEEADFDACFRSLIAGW
jgi:hypothetical protein